MTPLHLASVLLATVFLASAWGKRTSVLKPDDGVALWRRLAVPSLFARPLMVRLLPLAELLCAVLLLLPGWAGIVGAVLALVLLVTFTVVVLYALRTSNIASCGCFGVAGPPISRYTVVRNGGLLLLGVLALIGHVAAPAPSLTAQTLLATVALVGALVLAVWAMLTERDRNTENQVRRIEEMMVKEVSAVRESLRDTVDNRATSGPPVPPPDDTSDDDAGEYQPRPLPDLDVIDPVEGRMSLAQLVKTKPVVLVGFSVYCGVCTTAVEAIPTWQEKLGDTVRILAIHRESLTTPLERFPHLDGHIVLDEHGYVFRVLQLGNPSAVLLGADHTISGGPVVGTQNIGEFIDDIAVQLKEAGLLPD